MTEDNKKIEENETEKTAENAAAGVNNKETPDGDDLHMDQRHVVKISPADTSFFKRHRGDIVFFAVLILVMGAIIFLTHYVYGVVVVDGESMENTLHDKDIGIVQRHSAIQDLKRGDIIVFYSDYYDEYLVKRVIALSGDTLEIDKGVVKVNGKTVKENYIKEPMVVQNQLDKFTVPDGSFFAMGDNRNNSSDCRDFGPVDVNALYGIMRVDLGKYGITKPRLTAGVTVIVLLLLICFTISFLKDYNEKQNALPVPDELKDQLIEIDKSVCTGEMVIGFRDPVTGKLSLAEKVEDKKDIDAYCRKYGRSSTGLY